MRSGALRFFRGDTNWEDPEVSTKPEVLLLLLLAGFCSASCHTQAEHRRMRALLATSCCSKGITSCRTRGCQLAPRRQMTATTGSCRYLLRDWLAYFSAVCFIVFQPLAWMATTCSAGSDEGQLRCPNCEETLGKWSWNEEQCSCGEKFLPAFRVCFCGGVAENAVFVILFQIVKTKVMLVQKQAHLSE